MEKFEQGLIKINASTTREFQPDTAEFLIEFKHELSSKEECIEQFAKDFKAILNALTSAGVDRDTIKNDYFRITPISKKLYEKREADNGDKEYYHVKNVIDGCSYRAIVKFEIPLSTELLERCWIALAKTDGRFTFSLEFIIKDESEAERSLLAETVANARCEAETLAEAAGVKLGELHEITSGNSGKTLFRRSLSLDTWDDKSSTPIIPELNPGDIEIECDIYISWYIAQTHIISAEG